MVRILLRPTHSYELEACLDVRDMSTAGERAAWVRTRLIYILRRLKSWFGRYEPQLAQPGYQHPQLQGQYGQNGYPANAGYGYQPSYTQPQK
jgi:hypothetical protein